MNNYNITNLSDIDSFAESNNGKGLLEKLQEFGAVPFEKDCKKCGSKMKVKIIFFK